MPRRINQAGLNIIKSFEGLRLKPYICPAGIPTIGYGTTRYPTGRSVSLNDPPITPERAEEYLLFEVNKTADAVEKLLRVKVNDNEFSALVSLAYNIGIGALSRSTLLRLLNDSADRTAVADQFLRWNKAGGKELAGLTARRQAERALFLQPVIQDDSGSKKNSGSSSSGKNSSSSSTSNSKNSSSSGSNSQFKISSEEEILSKLKSIEEEILKS